MAESNEDGLDLVHELEQLIGRWRITGEEYNRAYDQLTGVKDPDADTPIVHIKLNDGHGYLQASVTNEMFDEILRKTVDDLALEYAELTAMLARKFQALYGMLDKQS